MREFEKISIKIFNNAHNNFDELALEIYRYQYNHNPIYKQFVDYLNKSSDVRDILQIPFLPVEIFKYHTIISDEFQATNYFESSGTTASIQSKHFFQDDAIYKQSYLHGFTQRFGKVSDWIILGLLPSYLERTHASLVNMVKGLMDASGQAQNQFYLYDYESLHQALISLEDSTKKVMLFGVTFALLDFAEKFPHSYKNLHIIETGGMKGRGKELTRNELHSILQDKLQPKQIFSEYGMTEMFSQAYSSDSGVFYCSDTMKVLKRNPYDPFDVQISEGRGNINVIDLANLHSCSFIATQDLGEFREDGSFEVLGRSDYSDVRGCNLMFV